MKRSSMQAIVLLTSVLWGAPSVFAGFFIIPFDATVFLKPVGGEAGAVTEFGFLTSTGDRLPLFEGLPNMPDPNTEIALGFFSAGTGLDFYESTVFGGTFLAFSNAQDQASLVAFTDTDNSLGMGGSVIERTSPKTWLFHLDDAASFLFDDDDNDVLIQLRLQSVPEPGGIILFAVGILITLATFCFGPKAQGRKTRIALAARSHLPGAQRGPRYLRAT